MEAFHPRRGTVPKNTPLEIYLIYEFRFRNDRVIRGTYQGSFFDSPSVHLMLRGTQEKPFTLVLPLSKIAYYRPRSIE